MEVVENNEDDIIIVKVIPAVAGVSDGKNPGNSAQAFEKKTMEGSSETKSENNYVVVRCKCEERKLKISKKELVVCKKTCSKCGHRFRKRTPEN